MIRSMRIVRLVMTVMYTIPHPHSLSYVLCKIIHCLTFFLLLEPVTGIEPAYPAWKAGVLPLNYTGILRWEHGSNPPAVFPCCQL